MMIREPEGSRKTLNGCPASTFSGGYHERRWARGRSAMSRPSVSSCGVSCRGPRVNGSASGRPPAARRRCAEYPMTSRWTCSRGPLPAVYPLQIQRAIHLIFPLEIRRQIQQQTKLDYFYKEFLLQFPNLPLSDRSRSLRRGLSSGPTEKKTIESLLQLFHLTTHNLLRFL